MPNIGPMELILILAIALIVLGPKKLPDAGRSIVGVSRTVVPNNPLLLTS